PCPDKNKCLNCAADGCAPVCGDNGKTYRNSCYAGCLDTGVSVEYKGACCDCPAPNSDTFVCDTEGTQHGNECIAACLGKAPAYDGPCVSGCVAAVDDVPACGFFNGQKTKFQNIVCAIASGATCYFEGACSENLNQCHQTDQQYAPVCGTLGDGTTTTFQNLCHAGCAGVSASVEGLCPDCGVGLCHPDDLDEADKDAYCGVPDCVIYPNKCIPTKCMEFSNEQIKKFDCPVSCDFSE
ncbi:MAG: hypothetical protein ACI9OJ_001059, partial [Myxococcota bacterium]